MADIRERKKEIKVLSSIIGLGTGQVVMLFSETGRLGIKSMADCVSSNSCSSLPPC